MKSLRELLLDLVPLFLFLAFCATILLLPMICKGQGYQIHYPTPVRDSFCPHRDYKTPMRSFFFGSLLINGEKTEPFRLETWSSLSDSALQQVYNMAPAVCQVINGSNTGAGSGTLIWQDDSQAVVLTAEHVVGRSGKATCKFRSGDRRQGNVHAQQDGSDIAIIHILPVPKVKPIPIAEQDAPRGSKVLAMGYGGDYGKTKQRLWAAETSFVGVKDGGRRFSTSPGVFISGDSGGALIYNRELVGVITGGVLAYPGGPMADGHGPSVGAMHQFLAQWFPQMCPPGGCQPYQPQPRQPSPRQRPGRFPVPEQAPTEPLRPVQKDDPPPAPKIPPKCELTDDQIKELLDEIAKDERFKPKHGKDGEDGKDGDDGVGEPGPGPTDTQIRAAVATWLKDNRDSLRPTNKELLDIVVAYFKAHPIKPISTPEPIEGWTHLALVMKDNASYAPRLIGVYELASEHWAHIKKYPPPAYSIGEIPALVAYQDGKSVREWRGLRQVEEVLVAISRSEFDEFLLTQEH